MKLTSLPNSSRLLQLLQKNDSVKPVRGELWLSSDFLEKAGFTDTVENHIALSRQLGQQIVCLPIAEEGRLDTILGYRYFEPDDIENGLKDTKQCVGVVIDGPFQRLVGKIGLMEVLMQWAMGREKLISQYAMEQEKALRLIQQCLEKNVDVVVLADDLSGDQKPFIDPVELRSVCTTFYDQAVSFIHDKGIPAFLHCCGNLKEFISIFNSWNIDGLAAIQTENNDIKMLEAEFDGVFMMGIEASLLDKKMPTEGDLEELYGFVSHLSAQKRLILSSSCGLYSGEFLDRIQHLYCALEKGLQR